MFEDPQSVTLAGQGLGGRRGVGMGDPDEQDETRTFEGTDDTPVDAYLGIERPLKQNTHPTSVP